MEKLPLANRNGLEDCKLFDVVQKFVDHENEDISRLAQDLLDEWSDLKCVYRIPKRAQVELIRPSTEDEDEDDITIYDEETEGEPVETVEPTTTIQDTATTASTEPKKNNLGHNKKKRKRIRYESSREFFDPDKDFFEYISMNATAEEILSKMQYPPRSSLIPTAPKAMLDTTSTTTSTTITNPTVHHSKHYKHKNHITPTINTTPGHFSYSTVNNDNISSFNSLTSTSTSSLNNRHFVSTSTPTIAANNNVNNTSTISTPISTLTINTNNNNMNTQPDYQQPQQQQYQPQPPHHHYYTEYYQDPSSMYDYIQFYYASAAAAAEGMTVEEYYYAYQVQQQQQQQQVLIQQQQQQQQQHLVAEPNQLNGIALPLNWQMATAEDGSVYYYNVSTQQTQWEVPVGDIPPPPPPPLPPPPPPPLSTIEGAPDSSQLEDLVEQAVNTTEDKKKKRLQEELPSSSSMNNSPTASSRDENHHLLTPASGSVDATTEDHSAYLNDIDLKREVGKVVTKYLSAKQQALWKGDKHLFKDLARKVKNTREIPRIYLCLTHMSCILL